LIPRPVDPELTSWSDALEALIAAAPLVHFNHVTVLAETASTQNAAVARSGGRAGHIVTTGRQTAGRGRLGRVWTQREGLGVAVTYTLPSRLDQTHVAMAAGLAAALAAESLLPGSPSLGIRWPNDVVDPATGRKLAGVLVEVKESLLLVGVGMNVLHTAADWPDDLARRAISLRELGSGVGRCDALIALTRELDRALALPIDQVVALWRERDTLVGTRRRFLHDAVEYCGIVTSVEPLLEITLRDEATGKHVRLPGLTTSMIHDDRGA